MFFKKKSSKETKTKRRRRSRKENKSIYQKSINKSMSDIRAGEEAFNRLRNNLQYSLVGDEKSKVIIVSSPEKGDGKSTVSSNLAKTIALGGKKVIIIDSDLRRPTLHRKLGTINEVGLVDILVGEVVLEEGIIEIEKNLSVITSGKSTAIPAELLLSKNFSELIQTLKKDYEYIIIDTAPINVVSDTLPILSLSNGIVLVARYRKTKKNQLKYAAKVIENTSNNLIGIVLNDVEKTNSEYYYYDYY